MGRLKFLDKRKSLSFLLLSVGQTCLLDRATHPAEPATEATDAEHTICGQTVHENLEGGDGALDPTLARHAAAPIDQEDEVEIGASALKSHLRLLIKENLHIFLGRRRLESGHEGGHTGHLTCGLVPGEE